MLLNDRFKKFQQRYYKIIKTQQGQDHAHEKLQAFVLSKMADPNLIKPTNFNFYFDEQKQKLIFSITGGLVNRDASDILHYFRMYDVQATWRLYSDNNKNTIRIFELDLDKVGKSLLDDFEVFLANPKDQENFLNATDYIPPTSTQEPDKLNNKWCNAKTLGRFAGFFAIGTVSAIVAYNLIQAPDHTNIPGYRK